MLTFKQIEALYWIAELGGFAAAAQKLQTTQAAISKRIHELETSFEIALFDRTKRSARLTEKGEEMLFHARELLAHRDRVLESMCAKNVLARYLRIGVTELTALTWLAGLVDEIRTSYPHLTIEPEVELSSVLFDRLMDDTIDLIIVPDVFEDARCMVTKLHAVENAWTCSPALAEAVLGEKYASNGALPISGIGAFDVLIQGNRSGTGAIYNRWFRQKGLQLAKIITSANLTAQLALTLSGIGISYLPVRLVAPLLAEGRLTRIDTAPSLPRVRYAALYRADRPSSLLADIATFAARRCDFGFLPFDWPK